MFVSTYFVQSYFCDERFRSANGCSAGACGGEGCNISKTSDRRFLHTLWKGHPYHSEWWTLTDGPMCFPLIVFQKLFSSETSNWLGLISARHHHAFWIQKPLQFTQIPVSCEERTGVVVITHSCKIYESSWLQLPVISQLSNKWFWSIIGILITGRGITMYIQLQIDSYTLQTKLLFSVQLPL